MFLLLVSSPVLAEDIVYMRHFEVSAPKTSAPKPVPIEIPEPRELRRIPLERLLLPIEADPATDILPDSLD